MVTAIGRPPSSGGVLAYVNGIVIILRRKLLISKNSGIYCDKV